MKTDPAADLNYTANGWTFPKTIAQLEQELAVAHKEIAYLRESLDQQWAKARRAGEGELLPCPFCGNDDTPIAEEDGYYQVYCTMCQCSTESTRSRSCAIIDWNRRIDSKTSDTQ